MTARAQTFDNSLAAALLAAACTVGAACSSEPPARSEAVSVEAKATTESAKPSTGPSEAAASQTRPASHKPACSLIDRTEMGVLLGAAVGRPSPDESKPGITSCTYPPADAGSWAQAEIAVEWEHGSAATFGEQLAGAFGGSVVGRQVAHQIPLGDSAAYSREGVLTIRTGRALITVTVPMRPDSEERATAIGRRLVDAIGPQTAPAPAKEEKSAAEQIAEALGSLVADAVKEKPAPEATPAPLPPGFAPDAPCPDVSVTDPDPGVEASAPLIPLVEGLTLSQSWIPKAGDYEHECLVQVTQIDKREITVTRSCPIGASKRTRVDHRTVCRADLSQARLYGPGTSPETPALMTGTTFFSLSQLSFSELKSTGATPHRFVYFKAGEMEMDFAGTLQRSRTSTYRIVVNDSVVDLPAFELSGALGTDGKIQPRGFVLNDERLPLLLDFGWDDYSVRFTKISFPAPSKLESSLEKERRVDVYGVYFDFASDAIRPESEPILKEIAEVLGRNKDWTLSINGHTDNIGGDRANLDLSRRRSEAVRRSLTERYGISPSRLTTGGFGASQPKDTNSTVEGRARNRRVELIRQ